MRQICPTGSPQPSNVEQVFVESAGPLTVLGIDPGLSRCGYGVVRRTGHTNAAVAAGVLTTPHTMPLPERLGSLMVELQALITEYQPQVVSVERVFFQTNVRTAMSVGQASGLALALASVAGTEVAQYTPNEVKMAVTGYGAAEKDQVQRMVQQILGLTEKPNPPDAADALALAICHLTQSRLANRVAAAGGNR